jgi:hypothetical protein
VALKDGQWGRLLALAWLDQTFKEKFETDPVAAVAHLKTNQAEYRSDFGDDFLDGLGLKDDNVVLANFESMSWKNTKFEQMSGKRLDECIRGEHIDGLNPEPSDWFWGDRSEVAFQEAQEGLKTLTARDWVRIYARIWMDHRLNTESIDEKYTNTYGPPQGYVEGFEKDPAATVKKIVEEIKTKKWGIQIEYQYRVTRLYAVADKPADWLLQELSGCVKTGKIRDKPFTLVVKKC